MRKLFALVALVCLTVSSMVVFAEDKPISVDKLPAKATKFINQYFSDLKVAYATQDDDMFDKSYEVGFVGGNKVEFTKKGDWTDVDCKSSRVPVGIIPKAIQSYIKINHPDAYVVEIDRDTRDYEVKLNDRVELKFDLNGNIIGFD